MARTITYKDKQDRRSVIVSAANVMKGSPEKYQKMLIDGYPYGKVDKNYGQADWKTKSQAQINERLLADSTLIHRSPGHFEWPLADISDKVYGAEHPDIFRTRLLLDVMVEAACIHKIDREISKGGEDEELKRQLQMCINNIIRITPLSQDTVFSEGNLSCGVIDIRMIINAIENIPSKGEIRVDGNEDIIKMAKKATKIWVMLKERINGEDFEEKELYNLISLYSAVVSSLRKNFLREIFFRDTNEETLIIHEEGIF